MRVRETQLPGVGVRYNLEVGNGRELIIVINNDGHRETYWQGAKDEDSKRLFKLTEREAQKIAEIYDGTYFYPVSDDISEVLEDAQIKWIQVTSDSPLAGRTIGETQIRSRTGASIIAIQRKDRTVSNPGKNEVLNGGDVLVVVGTQEQHSELSSLLEGM